MRFFLRFGEGSRLFVKFVGIFDVVREVGAIISVRFLGMGLRFDFHLSQKLHLSLSEQIEVIRIVSPIITVKRVLLRKESHP